MNHLSVSSVVAAVLAAAGLASAASTLVIGISFVTLIGGIAGAVYGAKRTTELRASQGTAEAWRGERDAEKAKADRLEIALREEIARRQSAEARSDISSLEKQVERNHREAMGVLREVSKALTAATTAVEFLSKHAMNFDLLEGETK